MHKHTGHAVLGSLPAAGVGLLELAGTGALGPVALGVGGLAVGAVVVRKVRRHRPGRRRTGATTSPTRRRNPLAGRRPGAAATAARKVSAAASKANKANKANKAKARNGSVAGAKPLARTPKGLSGVAGSKATTGARAAKTAPWTGNRTDRRAVAKAARSKAKATKVRAKDARRATKAARAQAKNIKTTARKAARAAGTTGRLRRVGGTVLRRMARAATFRNPKSRRRVGKIAGWAVQGVKALAVWTAALGCWAWFCALVTTGRIGNGVRAVNRASLAFLGLPFEGLGTDLRRFLTHLRGGPVVNTLPTVITRPVTGSTATIPGGMTVTTNLRALIEAIRENPGIGEDPHALIVEQWHADVAELANAVADLLHRDANHVAEVLPVSGDAHAISAEIGGMFVQVANGMDELTDSWRSANGTRLERLHSEESGEHLWDHSTRPDM